MIHPVLKVGSSIIDFPSLTEGTLVRRYKRFLADIELDDGEIITAHCANTGPMKGVLVPGGRVRVRYAPSSKRKLSWTWEQMEVHSEVNRSLCWVGINTALPNKLIKAAIESGCLTKEFGKIESIKCEVPYGLEKKSRIDLMLKPDISLLDQRKIYIEVKNTTWCRGNVALFPDTITTRGQKHLRELMSVRGESRAVLIPCISRNDLKFFLPGDCADPLYGKLFRQALNEGVEVIPCCFGFYEDHITWEGIRPLGTID